MLKKIDWYKVVGLCLLAWIGLSVAIIQEKGLRVRGYIEGSMSVEPTGRSFSVYDTSR